MTPDLPTHRIFGIDPGSRFVGFALIETVGFLPRPPRSFKVIDMGTIQADLSVSFTKRIGLLHSALSQLISGLSPSICVMEKAFIGMNPQTALKLGEARGALISAIARHRLHTAELAPTAVKKTITGQGRASKEQVCLALEMLTGFGVKQHAATYDASDALAIALAYGLTSVGI